MSKMISDKILKIILVIDIVFMIFCGSILFLNRFKGDINGDEKSYYKEDFNYICGYVGIIYMNEADKDNTTLWQKFCMDMDWNFRIDEVDMFIMNEHVKERITEEKENE